MFELVETYSIGDYQDVEVFKCTNCGETHSVLAGGDIACCPCEFLGEDEIIDTSYYDGEAF